MGTLSMSEVKAYKPGHLSLAQEKLQAVEDHLLTLPQADPQTSHHMCDGVYLRKILIPAGCCATGAVHLTETIDILVYGDLTVVTEQGKKRVWKPGSIFVSSPGLKKVAYAHQDTMWITAHAVTDIKEKTLEEIKKELWVDSYRDYSLYLENKTEENT